MLLYFVLACNQVYDVALVIDASLGQSSFSQLLVAASNVLEQFVFFSLPDEHSVARIGVVSYSSTAQVEFALNATKYFRDITQNRINSISQHNNAGRNLGNALDTVRTQLYTVANGERPEYPNTVVIFTASTSDSSSASIQAANQLKAAGCVIVTVGIGPSINQQELQTIASQPDYATILSSATNLQPTDSQFLSRISTIAGAACPAQSDRKFQILNFNVIIG